MTPADSQPFAIQPYAKLFTATCDVDIRAFIPVFHLWVKEQRTPALLIDVHDYSHVDEGPGVILVGHEAHYGMDRRDGRLGLVFRSRRTPILSLDAGLAGAVGAAIDACVSLEGNLAGKLAFKTDEILVGFEDRLRAPNTKAAFAKAENGLVGVAKRLFGEDAAVAQVGGERDLFGARMSGASRPLSELRAFVDAK